MIRNRCFKCKQKLKYDDGMLSCDKNLSGKGHEHTIHFKCEFDFEKKSISKITLYREIYVDNKYYIDINYKTKDYYIQYAHRAVMTGPIKRIKGIPEINCAADLRNLIDKYRNLL